ncbi:NAD(P)H-dependent glycerol-3-phosphate dehydrogenase [Limnohabitans sp. B9-3]|uniref:NAD(P)H-dependent glycerol-3-phosphate dehydrogenase n=1 Tax=Limnohabitans sp. B9-3 TaxID=1100707 RepID=UPI000C1EABB3|nr:NAD(P)H-dependent glycerol-3-phosphate dehydrogenase [Limnohabitans sp. B9-3]PIT78844.1 glycerol-3-phosphate dehydrogenase [Limnohabitans sp. B9-3]
MKIAVLGAGAWGTALAINAGAHHDVALWARDASQVQAMQAERVNTRYLPSLPFTAGVQVSSDALGPWLAEQDLVVVGSPMSALRGMLTQLAPLLGGRVPVAWLCKGFEAAQPKAAHLDASHASSLRPDASPMGVGLMAHEVRAQVAPMLRGGALSGPSFAQEVARGMPTALVAASSDAAARDAMVQAFHNPSLRVYANDDIVGVEVGGAVKNVLAIATGLCDGLQLGLNARAALITRGLAEITRLGVALGAKAETFMGLSGLGDLVLTATGDLSRNRKVGLALAQGMTLQQAVDSLGHVAEGVYCARTVVQRAQALGVDMPIAQAVVALLDGHISPVQAVAVLMGRGAKGE